MALQPTRRTALTAVAASLGLPAWAQNFPSKVLNLVVPYPAGGASDFVARKLQPDLAAKLGQTVVVDNVGGAGGSIGLTKVLGAPADGHTLVLGTPMELMLTPLAIQGIRYKAEDFRLAAQLIATNMVLAVRPSLDVRTVDDLIALARKSTDKPLSYGSVGPGSMYHLIGEKFAQVTKTKLLHVPYRGIANVIPDLIGGQIDMAFLPMAGPVMPTIADGKMKALGITAKTPHPLFKQYPAMAAMPGLAELEFDLWAGIEVPKGTPDEAVNRLNKALYEVMQNPDLRKALEATGNAILPPRSTAELATVYASEIERYRAIAKSINLQPQAQ
jgi:tripartite-type tricarboxylate transporter receptor subunit TctC